jgi:hypothetical protein
MEVDFDNLDNHIIPLDEFPLSWRFTDEGCNILSSEYISQFKFLDVDASKFLSAISLKNKYIRIFHLNTIYLIRFLSFLSKKKIMKKLRNGFLI